MQHGNHQGFIVFVSLIMLMIVLSGCSNSSAASNIPETGVVSESTVTDTVESTGAVSAKQLAALTWPTSGNVQQVNVAGGDTVTAGDELMRLDSTSAPADVIEAISTLITAKQNLIDVQQSKTDLATAEVALVNAQIAFNEAKIQYLSLGKPIGSEDYIAILKDAYISAQNSVKRAFKNYNGTADLADDNPRRASALANLAQARIDESDALLRLNHFSNPPVALAASIIQSNYDLAKAQLDEAQKTYTELQNGNEDAIKNAQNAVDAAQATVNQLSIFAPFDGQVAVVYSQEGDTVSQTTTALVLVDRSQLFIDVLVDEDLISTVKVGDPANITFSGLGIDTTGKVAMIDSMGVESSGMVYYTVHVELDETDPDILIGATATVVITTGEPQQCLFVPVSAVLTDAQGEYVTRINSTGTSERISVVTGDISNEKVRVSGELQKGDSVQLYSTTSSTSTTQNGRGGFFGLGGIFR